MSDENNDGTGGAPPDIELPSAWFCPYAQCAWMALEEKCGARRYAVTESIAKVYATDPIALRKKIPAFICVCNG